MQVYGQSTFTMLANPVVSTEATSVLYDAFATFTDDSASYNYTVVSGIAYLSKRATGFTIHGSDMDIMVEYMESRLDILAPTTDTDKCVAVDSPSLVTSIGRALLTGTPSTPGDTRKLKAAFEFSELLESGEPPCSCKSKPRPCIFIHGLGIGTEETENIDSYPRYWGNMTEHAPCCTSIKYAILNTLNNSWTSDTQQQKVCDHLLPVSNTSQGTIISDTIVVTHSMGGLMVAGALANGKCSFDKSTSWVATSTPMRGSVASDHFQESCKDKTNILMEIFVEQTGFCPPDDGIRSLAYENDSYSNPELNKAYKAAQKVYRTHTSGILCSNGYSGLLSSYQYQYWGLGLMVPHKTDENDGMVEFWSCAGGIPKSEFGDNYLDRYYVTKINHADASFRANDARLDKARMPRKWFECLL
ncbi:hypothetical protein BBO99_00004808 [Phytophthora kernoviae]|uniref:Uncharacterized protein n=1 Tax=Phytophthora kernoviae TaxID=325452 RepID=A0A3R7JZG7_9STRA|nr:hypothetical protein JM16_002647 [Phytophthora kernoviae]RLM96952.1 hypothetical protein BBI17_005268 [Phytophthora kernoviae]RLN80008.1 hypothetical protein BBO99_00004808 [Phytophthora kernoviae]